LKFSARIEFNCVVKMTIFLHRGTKFNRRLNTLKRGGNQASLAAKRAEEIIENLASGGKALPEQMGKLTKHGELRIDKCRKYDLGGGYRLVCVKQGENLVLSHVGTHDDCDRWIENNRGFEPDIDEKHQEVSFTQEEAPDHQPPEQEPDDEMDYDEILMRKIDENMLRRIFCGLCG